MWSTTRQSLALLQWQMKCPGKCSILPMHIQSRHLGPVRISRTSASHFRVACPFLNEVTPRLLSLLVGTERSQARPAASIVLNAAATFETIRDETSPQPATSFETQSLGHGIFRLYYDLVAVLLTYASFRTSLPLPVRGVFA